MPSATWVANKDTRVARRSSDSWDAGSGTSDGLPYGTYGGYIYRSFIGFAYDFAGITAITNATLYVRASNQIHIGFGSDPQCYVDRITEAWSEGSSNGLSASNATIYPGPSASTAERNEQDMPTVEGEWEAINMTAALQAALAAGVFYGFRFIAIDGSASHVGELYAREKGSSYRAYIDVTYETNNPPNTPTLTAPASGALITSDAPTLAFSASDPNAGDTLAKYDLQVATDAGFTALLYNGVNLTAGISGWNVSTAYPGGPFVRGTTYYWRVRVYDNSGAASGWSAARTFKRSVLPTVTGPTGNLVAAIHNIGDLVSALTPKPIFPFTLVSSTGQAITAYDIEVDGVITTVSGSFVNGAVINYNWPTAWVNLATHTIRFRARDAEGYGAWTTLRNIAVKYAQAVYEFNITGKTGIVVTPGAVTGTAKLLYRTATGAAGAGAGAWQTTVPAGTYNYLNVMVRLYSSGTAPAQPKLTTLRVDYNDTVQLPYSWTTAFTGDGAWALVSDQRRYGIKSMRYSAAGAGGSGVPATAYQVATNLTPDTDYSFSLWVWAPTWPGVVSITIAAMDAAGSADLAEVAVDLTKATAGWTRVVGTFRTEPSQNSVRFVARMGQSNDAQARLAYIDAAMLSEGLVAPAWTPALTGTPVIIDAQGIVVDGRASGLLRLFGSTGGARDIVELGARGLVFGGDTELDSPTAGILRNYGVVGADSYLRSLAQAGRRAIIDAHVIGDTTTRAMLSGDATLAGLELGPGNAARDTNLYRSAANLLKTDDSLEAAGTYLKHTGFLRHGGTSFPASPTTGDRYWRTDDQMEFFWNGTRWLSVTLYRLVMASGNITAGSASLAATIPGLFLTPAPNLVGGTDIWLEDLRTNFLISGGNALSASHSWIGTFNKRPAANTDTAVKTITINSGSLNVWRQDVQAIDALLGAFVLFGVDWLKTGTPGALFPQHELTYRVVET